MKLLTQIFQTRIGLLLSADDSQSGQEAQDNYKEILNQSARAMGVALGGHLGKPVNFSPAADSTAPSEFNLGQGFQFELGGARHAMALVPNSTLVETLLGVSGSEIESSPETVTPGNTEGEGGRRNRPADGPNAASARSDDSDRGNFDLLLEIEMQLGVSFGRSHLPLEEVLKLSSGAIVELNRLVSDPVDVLVNDAVIARGEVVVVEGSYGVRITEIVSRRERIRSIF